MASLDVLTGTDRWGLDIDNNLHWLRSLPADSVHAWVTSPPYYGLRSYLPDDHADKPYELGAEASPEEYVEKMVAVFAEARRVLHPSGVLWLNLGDSYNAAARKGHGSVGPKQETNRASAAGADEPRPNAPTLKEKDLIGVPWAVAFALRESGWYLRQWLPWVKRNPMTESVTDRPSSGCESIFLLSKSSSYFYDGVAIRREDSGQRQGNLIGYARPERVSMGGRGSAVNFEPGGGRNFRSTDLWFDTVGMLLNDEGDPLGLDVTVASFPGQHFAVFPESLAEPLILSGTSAAGVCPRCAEPWKRMIERERVPTRPGLDTKVSAKNGDGRTAERNGWSSPNVIGNRDPERHCTVVKTVGWEAGCGHGLKPVAAVVGDMFAGTGTTLACALKNGRRAIGCDLDQRATKYVGDRMATTATGMMSMLLGTELEGR